MLISSAPLISRREGRSVAVSLFFGLGPSSSSRLPLPPPDLGHGGLHSRCPLGGPLQLPAGPPDPGPQRRRGGEGGGQRPGDGGCFLARGELCLVFFFLRGGKREDKFFRVNKNFSLFSLSLSVSMSLSPSSLPRISPSRASRAHD